MAKEKEIERWVTMNGARIPIFKDGSIGGPPELRAKLMKIQPGKTEVPEFKSYEEAVKYYKDKFSNCSSTYRNKVAAKLGIEGRGQAKIDALAKTYADKWKSDNQSNNEQDLKDKQIANNQKQAEDRKETPVPSNKKIDFKKQDGVNIDDLSRNHLHAEDFSTNLGAIAKVVLYKDEASGYRIIAYPKLGGYSHLYTMKAVDNKDKVLDTLDTYDTSRNRGKEIDRLLKAATDDLQDKYYYESDPDADPFKGKFGERSKKPVIERLTRVHEDNLINPNYNQSKEYRINCALCATAVGLQAKGYNVAAQPRDLKQWRGYDSVFDIDYTNPDNYMCAGSDYGMTGVLSKKAISRMYKIDEADVPAAPRGAKKVAQAIEDKVKKWGDGGVGIVNVSWSGRHSAHAINVINQDGHVYFFDSQTNRVISNMEKYLERTVANQTNMVRVDNAKIKRNIKDIDKMIKRENKYND